MPQPVMTEEDLANTKEAIVSMMSSKKKEKDPKKPELPTMNFTEEQGQKAFNMVLGALEAGRKVRDEVVDFSLEMTREQSWMEIFSAERCISTRNKKDKSLADYYQPDLFQRSKQYSSRVCKAIFEGDHYYDVEPELPESTIDMDPIQYDRMNAEAMIQTKIDKNVMDFYNHRSGYVDQIKRCIRDGIIVGTGIMREEWAVESQAVKYRDRAGEVQSRDLKKEYPFSRNVDIFDFYIGDPYEEDLQKQPWVIEMWDANLDELTKMQKRGLIKNVEKIKDGALDEKAEKSGAGYEKLRKKMFFKKSMDSKSGNYKKVTCASYYGYYDFDDKKENEDGTVTEVKVRKKAHIIVSGNATLLIEELKDWHGMYPYVAWFFEKKTNEFYGIGMYQRLLKIQWLINQIVNIGIDNAILRLLQPYFVKAGLLDGLKQQVKDGVKRSQMIGVNTSDSIQDAIQPMQIPDPTGTYTNNVQFFQSVLNNVTNVGPSLQGQPTHSQVDRTVGAYQTTITESLVDIAETIYNVQRNLIGPSIEMRFSNIQQYQTETLPIQIGQYRVQVEPSDIYGMKKVRVYGGTLAVKRANEFKDMVEVVQAAGMNQQGAEQINYEGLVGLLLELKNVDPRIIRKKDPEYYLKQILNLVPLDKLSETVNGLMQQQAQQQEQLKQAQMQQQQNNNRKDLKTFLGDRKLGKKLAEEVTNPEGEVPGV